MAYTTSQQGTIAREIARAGGNLSAASKRLREEYETFDSINESTLRRMMKRDGFGSLIASEGERLYAAIAEGVASTERDRARRESEGLVINRLARDEHMLDQASKLLEEKLKTSNPKDIPEAVRAFEALARIIDRRRMNTTVAVANFNEAAALVQSVSEVAEIMLGARKREFTDAVKERYSAKIVAMQSAELAEAAT